MKRIITKLGMMMAMLLSFLPASAYDLEVDGVYYDIVSLPDMTCAVSGGKSDLSELTLPSSVSLNGRELKVVMIKEEAWKDNKDITSV